MNKDSSLLLLRWITPAGSLIPSFLGSPSVNPAHPPPSTAPTSETPGPTKHPGTPVFTISCLTAGIPVPVPCTFHYTVNKLITVKLCLLNCFLHVGQICSKQYDNV
ncbi:hypothetical protein AMECASPLE_014574 [Ameca splendens]|uniref:Uncharacterized protein n=1 Tax=Ameca splendens TaxID=208324 RepID=A0ABV0XQK3_9TELE